MIKKDEDLCMFAYRIRVKAREEDTYLKSSNILNKSLSHSKLYYHKPDLLVIIYVVYIVTGWSLLMLLMYPS